MVKLFASLALAVLLLGTGSHFVLSLPIVPSGVSSSPGVILAQAKKKKKGAPAATCFEACMKKSKSSNPARVCQTKCG